MSERLSRGVRIHNRREKAAARREKRFPDLIRPVPRISQHQPEAAPSFEVVPVREIIYKTPEVPTAEPPILRIPSVIRRRQPTFEEIVNAGRTLASDYWRFTDNNEKPEYLSDREAVNVLEELAVGIHTGRILSHKEIAQQVQRLGHKMGPMGSVSTNIDVAAWNVLDAITANKSRLGKLPKTLPQS